MTRLHRQRKQAHILTRIKNELKLSQAEIPELLGISLATFKNVVHGKQKSWEKHAKIVSNKTSIALECLIANNRRKPLLAIDGNKWTADKFALPIAMRHHTDLERNQSEGRHTLQWFRIVMIKVARCILAAYQEKKTGLAFMKLLRSIKEIGESFPAYTKKIPFKPKPGEPLRFEILPPHYKQAQITEACPFEIWDWDAQGAVAAIPSRSRKGMKIVFSRFVRAILDEEKRQIAAGKNDLIIAKKRVQKLTAKTK